MDNADMDLLEHILAGTKEPQDLPLRILEEITDSFSDDRKIGDGGFGVVYMGVLKNWHVAVKRIHINEYTVDDKIFFREVTNLLRINHPNVVRFLGFCSASISKLIKEEKSEVPLLAGVRERLLCFEYISNGSLDKHITDELSGLEWNTRYQIIKGICCGTMVVRRWKCRWKELVTQPSLQEQQVTKCIEIAEECMGKVPKSRPCILDVIGKLNGTAKEHVTSTGQGSLSLDDDMMWIEPMELHFAFECNKETSCLVELNNVTGNYIAFNISQKGKEEKTLLSELQYCTDPRQGVVPPQSQRTVKITLQAQESTPPPDIHRLVDVLILQSIKVKQALEDKHVTDHMFKKEDGKVVDKVKLKLRVLCAETPQKAQDVQAPKAASMDSRSNRDAREQHTTRLKFNPPEFISATNSLSYQYNQAHPQAAVDLVTGAMGGLLPKLRDLLKKKRMLPRSMKKDLESLERQLKRMQASLSKVSLLKQKDQLDPEDHHWACEVRELSYDIEDVVDHLLLRSSAEGSDPFTNTNHDDDDFVQIKETIEDIMDRVKEVTPWKVSDSLAETCVDDDPRILALYKHHKDDLVGIDGPRDDLIKWLGAASSTQQLKIISIFGPGGLGKTTLAKEVYDRMHAKFNLKAFVSVGRNPDKNDVLRDILLKLDKEKNADIHNRGWKQDDLIDELRRVLKYNRYLIVIDDIWDISSWKIIEKALMDNHQGSKIITTTRIFEVAESSGEVCELKPLSDYHSKELFNARLFGRKGTSTLDDPPMDEQFNKILKKCGGIPLAIITLASLLACKPREDWSKVYNSIGFGNEDNVYRVVENTRKILLFSYYDLPCYLQTCLLYLSIFPEDHEIEKNTLIWKWVGEGFVHEEPGKVLFKVGERYFNELINRSMIQPVGGKSGTYTVYACLVHDMVLDMICSVAKEENFVAILDSDDDDQNLSSEWDVRRLAVHKRVVEQHDLDNTSTCEQKVRSFNATRCRFSMMPTLPRFQVLRVLSFEDCSFTCPNDLKNSLTGLPHLRYLGLYRTPDCELPLEIGGLLRCLQTLDVRGAGVEILPQSLTHLRQLKCLRSEDRARRLPDGMGNLTCLEDLRLHEVAESPAFVEELGKLTELRVLHIMTSSFSASLKKALVESLSVLQRIEELVLDGDRDWGDCNWEGFSPPPKLLHLRLENIPQSRRLPVWINPSSIPSLETLTVALKCAKKRDLDTLAGFKKLRYLCLRVRLGTDKFFQYANAAGNSFPKLRYCDVPFSLTFLQGAMPCLEFLKFAVVVRDFEAANVDVDFDSMRYLPSLEKVHATVPRWNTTVRQVEKATAAVKRAVEKHPNSPNLVLHDLIGVCDDEYPVTDGLPPELFPQPRPQMSQMRHALLHYMTREPT